MRYSHWVKKNPLITLDIVKAILLMILAIAFINFNIKLGQVASDTRIIQAQQQKTLSSLAENSKIRTQQITTLTNHIDCVVDLFSHPNHDSLTIKDIKDCKLARTPASPSFPPSSSGGAVVSPKVQTPKSSVSSSPSPRHSSPPPSPPARSKKPGVVKQILNFLGV